MLNCDGVITEASANPTGGSEAGLVIGHWVQAGPGERL